MRAAGFEAGQARAADGDVRAAGPEAEQARAADGDARPVSSEHAVSREFTFSSFFFHYLLVGFQTGYDKILNV